MNKVSDYFDNWDYLYVNGQQGKYPSEMLIRFINSKFNNKAGSKILDLGCGSGRHLAYLLENGFDAYGIDGSVKAVEIAHNLFVKTNYNAKINHGSVLDRSLYETRMDAVIDIACMQHHILSDIKKIISNVYDFLVDGGYFFSMIKSPSDCLYKLGEKIEEITYKFTSDIEKVRASVLITFPSIYEIKELFACFAEVEVEMEEWTFSNGNKKVSHWVITAKK